MQLIIQRILLLLSFFSWASFAHGQGAYRNPAHWQEHNGQFYVGIEGVIFANQITRFPARPNFIVAADKYLEVRPVFAVGYRVLPRLSVEVGLQLLPIATGYAYENRATKQSFTQSYEKDYIYIPIKGIVQILGVGHRVGISLLGGGGYAWTSPENTVGSLITGSNTTIFTDNDGFGNTTTVTTTRQITKEQTSFAAFEAGIRGTWRILPKWTLDLTIRQLWATASSARDMKLTIDTSSGSIATNMNTPVSGVATGLGIRYTF